MLGKKWKKKCKFKEECQQQQKLLKIWNKIKINVNDVTIFFNGEFPPFYKHNKGHQHQQKIFNLF